jgi:hypothetical protein
MKLLRIWLSVLALIVVAVFLLSVVFIAANAIYESAPVLPVAFVFVLLTLVVSYVVWDSLKP